MTEPVAAGPRRRLGNEARGERLLQRRLESVLVESEQRLQQLAVKLRDRSPTATRSHSRQSGLTRVSRREISPRTPSGSPTLASSLGPALVGPDARVDQMADELLQKQRAALGLGVQRLHQTPRRRRRRRAA